MDKYAIVASGSHQFLVQENSVIQVEKLETGDNKEVSLNQVLMIKENGSSTFGDPFVANASVVCEVLGDRKMPKVINFKFKRRKNYRRKKGHRQTVTNLRVKSIQVGS